MNLRSVAPRSAVLLVTFAVPMLAPAGTNPLSPRLAWSQPVVGQPAAGQAATPYDAALQGPPSAATFAAYAQRADYFIKRHQAEAALADATQALELAPQIPATTPGYNANLALAYATRGRAKIETNLAILAVKDFDEALKLEPQNVAWLVARAMARGGSGYGWKKDVEAALALQPQSPEALTARGALSLQARTHFEIDDTVRATLRDYDAALAADPKYAPAYYERSKTRARFADRDADTGAALAAARADLDRAIALDPLFPLYYEERVSLVRKEQPAQALADSAQLIALEPDNPSRYLDRARLQRDQPQPDARQMKSDYDRVIGLGKAILKDFKGNAYARAFEEDRLSDALSGRGELLLAQSKPQQALPDFNQALFYSRTNLDAAAGLGLVLIGQGQPEQAIIEINSVMTQARRIGLPYGTRKGTGARGLAYIALKQWEEARVDLSDALQNDSLFALDNNVPSRNAEWYFNRGLAYVGLKQANPALADFNIAVKLDPRFAAPLKDTPFAARLVPRDPDKSAIIDLSETPTAHKLRGNEWRAVKQFDKALAEYSKAIALDANYADAYNNRAAVYKDKRQNAEALADFTKAIELKPTNALFLANRGNHYLNSGAFDNAIADFQKSVALDPTNLATMNFLGAAQQIAGKLAEAEATFRHMLDISTKEGDKRQSQVRLTLVRAAQNIAPTPPETARLLALPPAELQRVQRACAAQLKATPDVPALVALNQTLLDKTKG